MPNILLPVDGSDNSLRAVHHVIASRNAFREPVEIHLLNVQLPIASGVVRSYISRQQLEDYYRDEGLAAMASARAALDDAHVPYAHHIGVGELAATIIEYAESKQCNLIVMGTQGRGAVAGVILGSVTSRVVHQSSIPVLLVR